jgi:hypothetical protein
VSAGRIRVRVTEESGHGFTVETPYGEVTDLGTEFGLDLTQKGKAGLMVFEGSVDLRVAEADTSTSYLPEKVERLFQGDGVNFEKCVKIDRIDSILSGSSGMFRQERSEMKQEEHEPIILRVKDNKRETKKFYEIVPAGLREDAIAFVDMPHEWNGMTSAGMPEYLARADYVKTFNSKGTHQPDLKVRVTLSRPAKLYVFFNEEFEAPDWLKRRFRNTGDKIGIDEGYRSASTVDHRLSAGPGMSINGAFDIWELIVPTPETIILGDRGASWPTMYGIAAVALKSEKNEPSKTKSQNSEVKP